MTTLSLSYHDSSAQVHSPPPRQIYATQQVILLRACVYLSPGESSCNRCSIIHRNPLSHSPPPSETDSLLSPLSPERKGEREREERERGGERREDSRAQIKIIYLRIIWAGPAGPICDGEKSVYFPWGSSDRKRA